jgi:uroporphyrinogen-III synthase
MIDLNHAVVAIFESRRSTELAHLIRRHGGTPYEVPSIVETPVEVDLDGRAVLARLAAKAFDLVVLLTGVGVQRLFDEAQRLGMSAQVAEALQQVATVCRGRKPSRELRARGITPRYVVEAPHTTAQVLALLATVPLREQRVLIITAGEPANALTAFARAEHATVTELQLYRWDVSGDVRAALATAIRRIVDGDVNAVAFTTQVQVRHLFRVAAELNAVSSLREALNDRVLVGAIGPTCVEGLREQGVEADVVPEHATMGHLVLALAEHLGAPSAASREAAGTTDEQDVVSYTQALLAGVPLLDGGGSGEIATAPPARLPGEWLAALAILLGTGVIRAQLGAAGVNGMAVSGLLSLFLVYAAAGALRRRDAMHGIAPGRRLKQILLAGWIVLVTLPFPLVLAFEKYHALSQTAAIAADRGLGLGLGGYLVALLESTQLLLWLLVSPASRPPIPVRTAGDEAS